MIYLDNAATSMMRPPEVVDAVARALTSMGNASRGAHAESLAASRTDFVCRRQLASLFGVSDPQRVCFAANSAEALNIALMGLAMVISLVLAKHGDAILIDEVAAREEKAEAH